MALSNISDEHTSTNRRGFLFGRHYRDFYVFVSEGIKGVRYNIYGTIYRIFFIDMLDLMMYFFRLCREQKELL